MIIFVDSRDLIFNSGKSGPYNTLKNPVLTIKNFGDRFDGIIFVEINYLTAIF